MGLATMIIARDINACEQALRRDTTHHVFPIPCRSGRRSWKTSTMMGLSPGPRASLTAFRSKANNSWFKCVLVTARRQGTGCEESPSCSGSFSFSKSCRREAVAMWHMSASSRHLQAVGSPPFVLRSSWHRSACPEHTSLQQMEPRLSRR